MERLVAGRERIYLDRFWNELSANPSRIDEETRDHYAALYARPGAIHNALGGQFAAFAQDAIDNQQLVAKGKLKMPVLAIGGDHSYGAQLATEVGFAAVDVRAAVIKDSGQRDALADADAHGGERALAAALSSRAARSAPAARPTCRADGPARWRRRSG